MKHKMLIGWIVLGAVPLGCTEELDVGAFAPDASSEGGAGVGGDSSVSSVGLETSTLDTGSAQDAQLETAVTEAGTDAAIIGPGCTTTGNMTCDQISLSFLADGGSNPAPNVNAMAGVGPAPTPNGGIVTSGLYQLVAETYYGTLPPLESNTNIGSIGGGPVTALIEVTCDTYSRTTYAGGGGSEGGCNRLIPSGISGTDPSKSGFDTPYTATGSKLSLITTNFYGNEPITLGWFTVVDDYVLVSDGAMDASAQPRPSPGDAAAEASEPRDPRCPSSVPDAGTACDPSAGALECEYGGDTLGRCTQSTACALQSDGAFAFESYAGMGCDANAADCPASFSAASATWAMIADAGNCMAPQSEFECNYPEGVCACGTVGSSLACSCFSPGFPWGGTGEDYLPDGGTACPAERPLSGDGCGIEGISCFYGDICGGVGLGPSMACIGGYWERLDVMLPCPAPPACP
ncbi:MAG: hypothetical protein ABTD50_07155 [Polyangiaceae bacterium]|jgi:hypothetical protein